MTLRSKNPCLTRCLPFFEAGLEALRPNARLKSYLDEIKFSPLMEEVSRIVIVGAGRAAALIATELEQFSDLPIEGCVIVPTGYGQKNNHVNVVEIPFEEGQGYDPQLVRSATAKIIHLTKHADEETLVLASFSAEAQYLFAFAHAGLDTRAEYEIQQKLMLAGASYSECAAVGRHFSAIQGGRLAALAAPAPILAFSIPDHLSGDMGEDPQLLTAGGFCVADPVTQQDVMTIMSDYGIPLSQGMRQILKTPVFETLKPGDSRLSLSKSVSVSTSEHAIQAITAMAKRQDIQAVTLGHFEGSPVEVGRQHGAIVRRILEQQHPFSPPCLLISCGRSAWSDLPDYPGRDVIGGPNAAYGNALLQHIKSVESEHKLYGMVGATSGFDQVNGTYSAALLRPETLSDAIEAGLSPRKLLSLRQSGLMFDQLKDVIRFGATYTDVGDLRLLYIQ